MPLQSIGDLAQSFTIRQQSNQLKQQMDRLTKELASGQAYDLTSHLSGSFGRLSDIEHDLTTLVSYRTTASEAQSDTAAVQIVLQQIQTTTGDLANAALAAGTTLASANLNAVVDQANGSLDTVVAALNTDLAGRALFSGDRVSTVPLIAADDLLDEIRIVLAGAASTSAVSAALDNFFDTPGGGFETLIYQGGTGHLAAYQLGEGESVDMNLRADDPVFREVLKQTVAVALLKDPVLAAVPGGDLRDIARQSGEALLLGQDQITGTRASLGFAENRIERASVRIGTEITSLEYARGQLLSADPFETATKLESVQFQLETLYTLTARTARLNLVNFLS